jgi:hypothetical protein
MDKWPERHFSITFNPTLRPAIHFDVCLFEVRRGRVCVGMNAETVMLVRTVAGQLRTGFLFKNTKSSYYVIIYINRIESE